MNQLIAIVYMSTTLNAHIQLAAGTRTGVVILHCPLATPLHFLIVVGRWHRICCGLVKPHHGRRTGMTPYRVECGQVPSSSMSLRLHWTVILSLGPI